MPQVGLAVVAAAAGAYIGGTVAVGLGLVTAAGVLTTAGLLVSTLVGAVVAYGINYAGSAVLGLNKVATTGQAAQQAQENAREQLIRGTVEPQRIIYGNMQVGGVIVYSASSGDRLEFLHLVVAIAGHRCSSVYRTWINEYPILTSDLDANGDITDTAHPLFDRARIRIHTGTQTEADFQMQVEAPDEWDTSFIGAGITYAYIRLIFDGEKFASGLQDIKFEVFGADDVLDTRTGLAGYSNNPAMLIRHYLKADHGLRCADDEIDEPSFMIAANICDEQVSLSSDGLSTQTRYTADGTFTLDRTPLDIVDELLSSCAGTVVYVQGKYRLYAGAYEASTDTLGISDLAGEVAVTTKPPRRDLFNWVQGTFIEPALFWQESQFPAYSENTFIDEDGEVITRDIKLPWTIDGIRAQRLAKLALRRARESITIRAPVKLGGLRYAVWQTIAVTLPRFGFEAKPFRITAFEFADGVVHLSLVEEGSGSYEWNIGDIGYSPQAQNTTLVNPFAVPALAGLSGSEELYVSRDGTAAKTRAVLTWAPPVYPFIAGYDVDFRPSGGEWRGATPKLGANIAYIEDLAPGLYDWRVRARSTLAAGPWAYLLQHIGGLAAAPPVALTGLEIQTVGGLAYLSWDISPDIDVLYGGRIEFRHSPETSGVTWLNATSIGKSVAGIATYTMLPLKPGSYFAKAVDASGTYGAEATVTTAQSTALAFANVGSLVENPTFSGVVTNTVVTLSTLRLAGGGLIDAVPDFDALASVDGLGGVAVSGSYAFSGGIDLTTVKGVRLTSRLAAEVVNTYDTIDARSASIDTWLSFDGVVGGEADAWVEVRQTNDDPAGAPTWSAWRRVDSSDFYGRAFEFRVQLRSFDNAFNIHVTELSVTADEVV